ncbi:MAG TPA: alpha/beta fold hydrolase [Kofleriaceae bacterium]|nr:alpha/beta fold hydrolase [Kofleriaceae bacterium]
MPPAASPAPPAIFPREVPPSCEPAAGPTPTAPAAASAGAVTPTSAKVKVESLTIAARDGAPLAATLYLPTEQRPERVVIVACATAVRRGFYEPYARYLAAQGCAALTFDFRGIGGSLVGPVQRSEATILHWGELDFPAVVDAMVERFTDLPLHLVGHSVGGQLLGILDNCHRLRSVCTVAAQHGFWRLYPRKDALSYALLWYLVMPTLARLLSYFPARRLRLGEDLPKGVALQWSRWARSPHYMVDERGQPLHPRFARYAAPLLAYSFEDDGRAPERCVRALHRYFTGTTVEHRHVTPAEIGSKSIGHVGFFRAQHKATLWKDSLQWLRATPPAATRATLAP